MIMFGPFEILILILVGGGILFALSRVFAGRSSSRGGGFTLGHSTLSCPHCSQETKAGVPICERCGRDL